MEDLDVLQFPTYDQYFAAREQIPALAEAPVTLLFESSRGCWWGAKSQCTFCGLNGHAIGYRSKSPVRLLAELHALVERWPCQSIEAVDNILDMNYFETVFPELEKMSLPGPSFFEVKANLRRRHVAQLARAGITRIQPGIESLSDHVLELMRKGTTGLRNVQLLKWCREYGVAVDWNLLYGFPGERDVDYEGMLLVLPAIRHLQQPGACGPIRLDRFSPYFEAPAKHGLINVRAMHVYRFIYPLPEIRLNEIAYYFDYDYEQSVAPSSRALETAELAHRLRTEPCAGSLR
ncbi:MAG: Hopanoid methylase, partial [Pseudomonadota bacterium]